VVGGGGRWHTFVRAANGALVVGARQQVDQDVAPRARARLLDVHFGPDHHEQALVLGKPAQRRAGRSREAHLVDDIVFRAALRACDFEVHGQEALLKDA
jgi:hypothetical protein